MKVYLDVCCLNHPFDDQNQDRIRLEAEAILLIMSRLYGGEWVWLGSDAVDYEIGQTPDPERRHRVQVLTSAIHQSIQLTQNEAMRAKALQALGFK